jgi:glycosyltransferase involved in cell wall biosynthesis
MNGKPAVSCMCLTYGRPKVLEEAIHSFLQQDYEGTKELIVLNDYKDQVLEFDHPEVVVINVNKRFRTVGEKRNATAALCSHDILFVWDDDDIYLPHRITYSIERYDEQKQFFKPSKALVLNNGKIEGPKSNLFHSGSCWSRQLFDKVRGYCHMGSGQDLEIEAQFEKKHTGKGKNLNNIPNDDIYYLYRWGGTGSFHLSGFGKDKAGEKDGNAKVAEYIERKKEAGQIPTGIVKLNPHWEQDYRRMICEYLHPEGEADDPTPSSSSMDSPVAEPQAKPKSVVVNVISENKDKPK